MEGLSRYLIAMLFLAGPQFVNWWEYSDRYPVTAIFAGAALVGLYVELSAIRNLLLSVHRMLWEQRYPGEPWE